MAVTSAISPEALLHVMKNLPAAPGVLARLGGLLLDPAADLADVAAVIRPDPAITARVIRISNSAAAAGAIRASAIDEALLRIGLTEVYRLVGVAVVSATADDGLRYYGISGVQFRANAVYTALLAEALAPYADVNARAAYTAGLLRSSGKIAIDRLIPGTVETRAYPRIGGGRPIHEWEAEVAELDSCTAAGMVLERWQFPAAIVDAITDHCWIGPQSGALSRLLHAAAGLAERAGCALPGEASYWSVVDSLAVLGVAPHQVENAEALARTRFDATAGVLESVRSARAA